MGYSWSDGGWRKSNFARLGGAGLSWMFNHSPASLVYGKWDYDDYNSMQNWSNSSLLGRVASSRTAEMQKAENDRWWAQMGKYYGFDPDNMPFPIRAGRYGNASGGLGATTSAGVQATRSVMSLYKPIR